MLSVTKTDEIDARLIALYGERMQPDPYKLRSDSILVLKQKRTVLRQLKKQLVATRNLKGSMEFFLLLTLNARKPSKRRLLSSRSKSRQWKRISLPWRKASTGNRWTCSPPSKASVLHWQPRLSWPQAGSPILIMQATDPLSGPVTYLPTVRYVSQCQRSHQPERGFKPQKPALCGGFLVTQV